MASNKSWRIHLPLAVAALLLAAAPARADFFDDVRRTFQTDIPHFFQDDIPCAFGGRPTSGAKAACHGAEPHPAAPTPAPAAAKKASAPAAAKPRVEVRAPPEYP
jgi:hypothetical protein